MKSITGKLLLLAAVALMGGCSSSNLVSSAVPTGPIMLEPPGTIFGPTRKLMSSVPQIFVLTNPSSNSGSAIITGVATNSDQFLLESAQSTCPTVGTLPAGLSCKIVVKFVPSDVGRQTGALTVTDSAANSPQTATLVGDGKM